VTIPPLQISNNVATHVNHAKRFNHLLSRPRNLSGSALFEINLSTVGKITGMEINATVVDSPLQQENLTAGARGRRGRGGFVFWFSGWFVLRLRRTSRSRALRAASQLGAFF
jgi:hypothetical protein